MDHHITRDGPERVAHQTGARGDDLVRFEDRPVLAGDRGEEGGLASGARAQVEPPLPRPDRRGLSQSQRDELRTFVLDADSAARGFDGASRVAAGRRESGGGIGPTRVDGLGKSGQRHESHFRRYVVGLEQRLELVDTPLGRESTSQGPDDPDRMGRSQREALVVGARVLLDPLLPLLGSLPRDPPEHGVREARCSASDGRRHQVHRLVDGGVGGDAGRQ